MVTGMTTGIHRLGRNIMEEKLAWLAAALLLLQIIGAHDARAATTPISSEECAVISRYAVAARALAEARVDKKVATGVLRRMHTNLMPASTHHAESDSRWHRLSAGIVDYAYRARSYPSSFVADFEAACAAAQTPPGVPAENASARIVQPRMRM